MLRPHSFEWEAAMTSDIAKRTKLFTEPSRSNGQSRSIGTTAAALVQGAWQIVIAVKHRRELASLSDLDDRMLADIGLRRSDVQAARSAPFWRDWTGILCRARELRWISEDGRRGRCDHFTDSR
jgi:uncharacterized protein YjiS (DUF1127 family)